MAANYQIISLMFNAYTNKYNMDVNVNQERANENVVCDKYI